MQCNNLQERFGYSQEPDNKCSLWCLYTGPVKKLTPVIFVPEILAEWHDGLEIYIDLAKY